MTGNWLIGGSMKVNRVLDDKEVRSINKAAGVADLPRAKPFSPKKYGFASGGLVAPDEWKAEEHVNHLPAEKRNANLAKFLKPSKVKDRMYHGTSNNFTSFGESPTFLTPNPKFASKYAKDKSMDSGNGTSGLNVMPVHVSAKNPFDYQNKQHIDALHQELSKNPNLGPFTPSKQRLRSGSWNLLEDGLVQDAIKKLGHDSFFVKENSQKNLGVFDSRQIKSAIGNRGTYDTTNPDITKKRGGRVTHAHHLDIEERPL
jgi:hypothetical protein